MFKKIWNKPMTWGNYTIFAMSCVLISYIGTVWQLNRVKKNLWNFESFSEENEAE